LRVGVRELGFGVWGLGFGFLGLGLGVWGLGFGGWGLGLWDLADLVRVEDLILGEERERRVLLVPGCVHLLFQMKTME
jgi:hypothetical protein